MDSQSTEERAEKVIIALTPEQLKDICANAAEIGAKEALKTYEQERKKEQGKRADRRLRNTKLLLRNYHMLKEHAENSVFGRTQMEESALDILESMMNLYDNEVIIESIKRNCTMKKQDEEDIQSVIDFIKENPERTSSDIIEYLDELGI